MSSDKIPMYSFLYDTKPVERILFEGYEWRVIYKDTHNQEILLWSEEAGARVIPMFYFTNVGFAELFIKFLK